MAAIRIIKLPHDEASVDGTGMREVQQWQVTFDGITSPRAALTASIEGGAAIPAWGTEHDDDSSMFVTSKTAAREDGARNIFRVVVTYAVPQIGWGEAKPEGENVKWNKRVSVSGVETVEGTNFDTEGDPIRNSFGDVYSSDIPGVIYDQAITVSFNTDTPNVTAIEACRGKVNDAEVTIALEGYTQTFPAGTLRLGNATADAEISPTGETSWAVTLPFVYRSQLDPDNVEMGWKTLIVDKGFRYENDAGKTIKSEVEVFLDGDGKKLPDGDPAVLQVVNNVYEESFTDLLADV